MNEQEAETLAAAYGQEKEPGSEAETELDVDVSGKVTQTETKPEGEESVEQLKTELEALQGFYEQVMGYTEPVDENSPDSNRVWNIEKIVSELGYDFSSLKKKGETVEVKDTSKESAPTEPEKAEAKKDETPAKGFTLEQVQQIVQKAVAEAVNPLQAESKNRKAKEVVASIREKHPDFDAHKVRIGELAKNFRVETAEQLEALYFAAKGENSANNPVPPKTGLANTVNRSEYPLVEPDVADAIMQDIVGAGAKPASKGIISELTGSETLSPMD